MGHLQRANAAQSSRLRPITGMNETDPATLLDRITASKRREVSLLSGPLSPRNGPIRSLAAALKRPPGSPLRVIAECKKASPSQGLMRPDYDPAQIALEYENLGAAGISVLTDGPFFSGSLGDLRAIKRSVGIPILRKDFTLEPIQIEEAWSAGADGVLLIVRLLSEQKLSTLLSVAREFGLDTLVETHSETEIEAALAAGATLIGINHRDLDTLRMDLSLTERLAPRIRREQPDAIVVAESGVETPEGRARMEPFADAVLVGTAFMRSSDIAGTWRTVFGG